MTQRGEIPFVKWWVAFNAALHMRGLPESSFREAIDAFLTDMSPAAAAAKVALARYAPPPSPMPDEEPAHD